MLGLTKRQIKRLTQERNKWRKGRSGKEGATEGDKSGLAGLIARCHSEPFCAKPLQHEWGGEQRRGGMGETGACRNPNV